MFRTMQFLHLLTAIFTIGPMAHAATTAARGLRRRDARAAGESARMTRVYTYASLLAVVFGFGLMSQKSPRSGKVIASFSDTYIWGSTLLWMVAAVIALAVVVPGLEKAQEAIDSGEDVGPLRARVAAGGGAIGVILALIVVLMVYKPF